MDFYWAIAIFAIGALLGLFFALNGFSAPAKSEDLKNTARVRNLMWLVTGAAGVVLADWKKLTVAPPESGYLFVSYLIGAIAGAVFGLLMVVIFISIDIALTNRGRSAGNRLPAGLVVDYLHYGYAYYSQRRSEAAQQATREMLEIAVQERLVRLQRDASVQDVIAGLVHAIATVFAEPDAARRQERQGEVVDSILAGVAVAVTNQSRSDVRDLRLRVNYMTFVSFDAATAEQKAAALFRFGDEKRYSGLLVLQQPAGGSPQETVILPVDGRISDRERLLPGAPEALVSRKAAIINCKAVRFSRNGIDAKTKTAIQSFFKEVDYASVGSIPVLGKDGPKGIINIESNREDLLGEGEELGRAVCGTLQPFTALLSRMV